MFTSFHTIGIATGSLLALMLLPIAAHADEPVTVQDILAAPTIYHLRQTKLQGTVSGNPQPLDPYENSRPAADAMAAISFYWTTTRP